MLCVLYHTVKGTMGKKRKHKFCATPLYPIVRISFLFFCTHFVIGSATENYAKLVHQIPFYHMIYKGLL